MAPTPKTPAAPAPASESTTAKISRLPSGPRRTPARRPQTLLDGPGRWLILVAPFLVFGLAALTAAAHRGLGSPLGEAAAAKMADVAQVLAMAMLGYIPAVIGARRARQPTAPRRREDER